jgi:tetratricopeptide (TPR) repeat protein
MRKVLFILSILMSINSIAQNKKSFLRNGNELYADSSYNEAEIQYRKSLLEDQDYFNASFNLADAIYKQERYEESSALFDALKDDAPTETDLAKVYHNIGNSLVKEQKLDEAISAYKSALRINPNDKDTRHNLALTHQQKQQQEDNDGQEKDKEGKNKQKEKKEQEQNQENKEQQEDKQENKPEEKKEEMSKETAEKMLEAIQQQEKELQEELQKKKVKGKRVKVLKDW